MSKKFFNTIKGAIILANALTAVANIFCIYKVAKTKYPLPTKGETK